MANVRSKKETTKELPKLSQNEVDKKFNRFLEEVKVTNDYLKHIATLDTGSILIMVTFLQKSDKAGSGSLVALSAFLFIISLTGIIAAQGLLTMHTSRNVDNSENFPSITERKLYRSAINLGHFCFVLGVATLAVFIFYTLQI